MSKSNGKCRSTSSQNHLKLQDLDIREREVRLVRDQNEIEQSKMECARRNVEVLTRLDIHTDKHKDLKKEVLETIKGNLSVLSVK